MKTLYFDCFSGISGNMIIGALVDAGVPLDNLRNELNKLSLGGYELSCEPVQKRGIQATYFNVILPEAKNIPFRHYKDIVTLLKQSSLNSAVKELAQKIFKRLAEAESKIHNCPLEEVHFHEIGAIDTIIDIVGVSYGINYLGIEQFFASPVHVGSGIIDCAHGQMPIPAPATAELLKESVFYSTEIKGELVTPTGAAILTTLTNHFGPLPSFKCEKVSYGAGTWELKIPNVLRIYIGETIDISRETDYATIIETNIDDMNPEFYSYIMEKLFEAGAVDVYLTPIYMKKNRPGSLLTIISTLPDQKPLLDILFAETTTLGIRMYTTQRLKQVKTFQTVDTPYGPVKVKLGFVGNKLLNFAPEFEDCRKLAEKTNIPLKEIYQEVLILFSKTEHKERSN